MKVVEDCRNWLSYHRVWGKLPAEALQALTQSFYSLSVEPRKLIYQEGQTPNGLYLLKLGTVEIFRQSLIGQLVIRYCQPGDLFDYTLIANVAEGTYQTSAIAITDSEVLFLPKAAFDALIVKYPSIQQVIQSQLAEDLQEYSTRIATLEMRIQGLQSYIQPVPSDKSILGKSKAAQKLTQQINQAAASTEPVVLQAQTGTGKTFVAGLIHAQSALASQPFAEMDCADLTRAEDGRLNTDALFGRVGQQMGILELLERGTLLLDNVQVLSQGDRARLIHYLKTGLILPNQGIVGKINPGNQPRQFTQSSVRLILASPNKLDLADIDPITIKLFPLSQRRADIPDFADYFLNQFCREHNRPLLKLDQSDLRRLISYDYPANLREQAEILHRAVIMTPPEYSVIPEQALWSVQSTKNTFRLDLLTHVPGLRELLLSRWYPGAIWVVMMAVFIPVIVLGFIGSQQQDNSATVNYPQCRKRSQWASDTLKRAIRTSFEVLAFAVEITTFPFRLF
ncbi:MAG: sigma 54-interacting transcriptional regulator, partial [Aetokthonos hydrillicola CCALA 1050]|nr:sigma 54-interacting transcriptional regulator [Aetokthonos hydrillicola CCALA 1050]